MNSAKYQILRLITGGASVALCAYDSPFWWVAVIPWFCLCIFGFLATLPIFIVIGIGAGAAQADWMSDEFIIGLVFVTPTILAMVIAEIGRQKSKRVKEATSNPPFQSS